MTSMADIPVWIISSGYILDQGLMGCPMMSRKSSAKMFGPLSFGFPDPLNTRPTEGPLHRVHTALHEADLAYIAVYVYSYLTKHVF